MFKLHSFYFHVASLDASLLITILPYSCILMFCNFVLYFTFVWKGRGVDSEGFLHSSHGKLNVT